MTVTLTRVLTHERVDGKKGHNIELRQHESTIQVWWQDSEGAWFNHLVFKDDGSIGALKNLYENWLPE